MAHYSSMGTSAMSRHKLLAAKGALIASNIPHALKGKMLSGYRSAEKHLFGSTTTLPGEDDTLHNQLGVSGLGLNTGQRIHLRDSALAAESAPDTDTSNLTQALLSHDVQ